MEGEEEERGSKGMDAPQRDPFLQDAAFSLNEEQELHFGFPPTFSASPCSAPSHPSSYEPTRSLSSQASRDASSPSSSASASLSSPSDHQESPSAEGGDEGLPFTFQMEELGEAAHPFLPHLLYQQQQQEPFHPHFQHQHYYPPPQPPQAPYFLPPVEVPGLEGSWAAPVAHSAPLGLDRPPPPFKASSPSPSPPSLSPPSSSSSSQPRGAARPRGPADKFQMTFIMHNAEKRSESPVAERPKKDRKISHKVVERRYRNNLNDRIYDLKDVVPTLTLSGDERAHKPTILKKAQEYILYLQGANARLLEENQKLKSLVKTLGGTVLLEKLGISNEPEAAESPKKGPGMSDGVRILIICFMAFCLFSSPITLPHSDLSPQRHLQSAARSSVLVFGMTIHEILSFLSSLVMHTIFICACLFAVFVGDPLASMSEHQMKQVLRKKEEAEDALKQGDLSEGASLLNQVLVLLGRPRHLTQQEALFSLVWQISRQVSHLCLLGGWVDRFLATRTRRTRRSFSVAALSYHLVHKIQIARNSSNPVMNMIVCLSSLNLAEAVNMEPIFMANFHASLALQLKLILPGFLGFISAHYLRQASKNLARSGHVRHKQPDCLDFLFDLASPSSLNWLSHQGCYSFFHRHQLSAEALSHCGGSNVSDPFRSIGSMFSTHLLEQAFGQVAHKRDGRSTLVLFREVEELSKEAGDLECAWWAMMGRALSLWSAGELKAGIQVLRSSEALAPQAKPLANLEALDQGGVPAEESKAENDRARRLAPEKKDFECGSHFTRNCAEVMRLATSAFAHYLQRDFAEAREACSKATALLKKELDLHYAEGGPQAPLSGQGRLHCLVLLCSSMLVMETSILTSLHLPVEGFQDEGRNFRRLASETTRDPSLALFLRSYLFAFQAVSRARQEGQEMKTTFLFEKSLECSRACGDKHGEGLCHFYRGAFGTLSASGEGRIEARERRRRIQPNEAAGRGAQRSEGAGAGGGGGGGRRKALLKAIGCFREAGSLGYLAFVEEELASLSV